MILNSVDFDQIGLTAYRMVHLYYLDSSRLTAHSFSAPFHDYCRSDNLLLRPPKWMISLPHFILFQFEIDEVRPPEGGEDLQKMQVRRTRLHRGSTEAENPRKVSRNILYCDLVSGVSIPFSDHTCFGRPCHTISGGQVHLRSL